MLFEDGIHLVTGIRLGMKNRLMPMWYRIMLRWEVHQRDHQ